MIEQKWDMTLAPDDPDFASTVIEETRALIEQVASWARERSESASAGTPLTLVRD